MSSPSTEQEFRALTTDPRVTWAILSTATDEDINEMNIELHLSSFDKTKLKHIALRHPDRAGNQGKFLLISSLYNLLIM